MPLTTLPTSLRGRPVRSIVASALSFCAAVVGLSAPATADCVTSASGAVTVHSPWSRATPGGVTVGVAYLNISLNAGDPDRLTGARSDRAGRVEIHTHKTEDGVMKMRRVEALDVTSEAMTDLKPGGHHLMLFDLSKPLKAGELVPLTLVFEKAGEISVKAKVAAIGAKAPKGCSGDRGSASAHDIQHDHDHSHGDHDDHHHHGHDHHHDH